MDRGYLTGRYHSRRMPKRGVCPSCDLRGMTTWKAHAYGFEPMFMRYCQYCAHSESLTSTEFQNRESVQRNKRTSFTQMTNTPLIDLDGRKNEPRCLWCDVTKGKEHIPPCPTLPPAIE